MKLPGGHQITVDYAVSPILQDDGTFALVLEILPLDRMLRISREEGILSSQQNTRALVRGLAHEIKNPLGGLRGAAQLLARELPDIALKDYTNIIIEEADRLRNLVDQMLGPHKVPEKKPLNVHEVVERVRHLLEAETKGQIHFVRDYDPSIPDLLGDKEQLIQAVLNIVRNAVEAINGMAQKPPRPTILLRTRSLRQFTIGRRTASTRCQDRHYRQRSRRVAGFAGDDFSTDGQRPFRWHGVGVIDFAIDHQPPQRLDRMP